MHPRNRELQALIDAALPAGRAAEILEHAATCARCTARIATARALSTSFASAVHAIDATGPSAWFSDVAPWTADTRPADPATRTRRTPLRWAALFVLGTAAAGGAALVGRTLLSPAPNQVIAPVTPATTSATPPVAGSVSVQPAHGSATVALDDPAAGSMLYVTMTDAAAVTVRVEGIAAPRFRVSDGSVDVALDGQRADVHVLVPAATRDVIVRANGRIIARVRDGRIDPADAASGIPIR